MNLWNDPVNFIALWLSSLFVGWGAAAWLASLIIQFDRCGGADLYHDGVRYLPGLGGAQSGGRAFRTGSGRIGLDHLESFNLLRTLSNSLSRKTLRPMAQTKWFITLHRFFL